MYSKWLRKYTYIISALSPGTVYKRSIDTFQKCSFVCVSIMFTVHVYSWSCGVMSDWLFKRLVFPTKHYSVLHKRWLCYYYHYHHHVVIARAGSSEALISRIPLPSKRASMPCFRSLLLSRQWTTNHRQEGVTIGSHTYKGYRRKPEKIM